MWEHGIVGFTVVFVASFHVLVLPLLYIFHFQHDPSDKIGLFLALFVFRVPHYYKIVVVGAIQVLPNKSTNIDIVCCFILGESLCTC